MDGVIVEAHRDAKFTVELDNGHKALCHACGKIRQRFIRLTVGDRVQVELSPYDLGRGRITYRVR